MMKESRSEVLKAATCHSPVRCQMTRSVISKRSKTDQYNVLTLVLN